MSYILEGLKKIERSRQGIGMPGVFAKSGNVPPGRQKRTLRKYFLLLALVLFLVTAAAAYRWRSTATFAQSDELLKQQSLDVEISQNQPPQADAPQRIVTRPEQRPLDPPLVEKQENLMMTAEHQPAKKDSRHRESISSEGAQAGDEETVATGSGEKIIPFGQLPEDVKKNMPEVKVFLHYYSPEAKERFVQVNEHTLHEGQSRPDGLKVLRISEQAAIFSYQGHRFQILAIEK